ncbi:hypothetical protein FRC10_011752 [Ceratobasidium sp. 414]|nr:hypothetical protein FRC10_011752 [Ceratobasidium sp. 414]
MSNASEEDKRQVKTVMDRTNRVYALLPFEDDYGLWAERPKSLSAVVGMPTVLPEKLANLPDPINFFLAFKLPDDYFKTQYLAPLSSTFAWFETWVYQVLTECYLIHEESKTFICGPHGLNWLIQVFLLVILNIGAVLGKVKPPCSWPENLCTDTVSANDWKNTLKCLDAWSDSIQHLIEVLQMTYDERYMPAIGTPGTRTTPNDPTPENQPTAGPSHPTLCPRMLGVSHFALDGADLESNTGSSWSLTDDEGEDEDQFKPVDDDAGKGDLKGKGKGIARGECVGAGLGFLANIDPVEDVLGQKIFKVGMRSSKEGYEMAKGFHCERICSGGPISEFVLDNHPLGPLSRTKGVSAWSGTLEKVQEYAEVQVKQCCDLLHAYFGSPQPMYLPEDDIDAYHMAIKSVMTAKPLVAILLKQRIIWIHAKKQWPTNQFWYACFMELMRIMFQLTALIHDVLQDTPADSDTHSDLSQLLRCVERVELHDLGTASYAYHQDLPAGWENDNKVFEFKLLQVVTKTIVQWSDDVDTLGKWHQETCMKTWTARHKDLEKSPVPMAVWYQWSNPDKIHVSSMLNEPNQELEAAGIAEGHVNMLEKSNADSGEDATMKEPDDIEIDEMSPGEEDKRAMVLLRKGPKGVRAPKQPVASMVGKPGNIEINDMSPGEEDDAVVKQSQKGPKAGKVGDDLSELPMRAHADSPLNDQPEEPQGKMGKTIVKQKTSGLALSVEIKSPKKQKQTGKKGGSDVATGSGTSGVAANKAEVGVSGVRKTSSGRTVKPSALARR